MNIEEIAGYVGLSILFGLFVCLEWFIIPFIKDEEDMIVKCCLIGMIGVCLSLQTAIILLWMGILY